MCPPPMVPSPVPQMAAGSSFCVTPMSGSGGWMTGCALDCCRVFRPRPSRSSLDAERLGWRGAPTRRGVSLLRVVSLRNLSPRDSRQYLHACGVDPARHDQLVELAHGHPMALSLLADVYMRGGESAGDPLTPDRWGSCCDGSSRSSPVNSIAGLWRCAQAPE